MNKDPEDKIVSEHNSLQPDESEHVVVQQFNNLPLPVFGRVVNFLSIGLKVILAVVLIALILLWIAAYFYGIEIITF